MMFCSLRQFAEAAPTCYQDASRETVFQLLHQGNHERLVVLNAQHSPVGVVRLAQVLPELIAWQGTVRQGEAVSAVLDADIVGAQGRSPTAHSLPMDSVGVLPAHLPLEQFWSCIAGRESQTWVLVDHEQHYVGLLNIGQLVCFWAEHRPSSDSSIAVPTDWPRLLPLQQKIPYEVDAQLKAGEERNQLWTEVMDKVPLPLMIQTHTGQVLVQNEAWQSEVGDLQYPDWVRQEATALLGPQGSEVEKKGGRLGSRSAVAGTTLTHRGNSVVSQAEDHLGAIAPGSCQAGPDVNTCLCACVTKDGRVRVWQFLRIPLNTHLEGSVAAASDNTPLPAALSPLESFQAFQLAHLQAVAAHLPFRTISEARSPDTTSQRDDLWLIVARDTTEQQQLSKELAAKNADLVQLNRFKDEFLACISHELRTPLTAVLGLSHLLKDSSLGALNERQTRYARLIHESGQHLMAIVNNILDLTRIETGQLDLMLEPVVIHQVCHRVIEQSCGLKSDTSSEAQTKPRTERSIAIDIEPSLELLMADELRLRQMLTHLLSNAMKFTPPEGKVGLEVKTWGSWIAFTVWDTGIGIPTDKQHLIFQKFQQLESPLNRQFEGTGLGLVLTQRLARLHGGDVTFTSIEGQGSRFTLLMPPAPPEVALNLNLDLALSLHAPRPNRLALVVEAVPRFIDDLTDKLMRLGYRVAIARSGPEALEKVRRLQPCAVFLNPLLPLLSGWDVLTLLKADAETQHIPVIVTATPIEHEQAKENRASGFLTLPVEEAALQQALTLVDQVTESESYNLSGLTVLYLDVELSQSSDRVHERAIALKRLLQNHSCRLLEIDDLDQAEILARVWKPNVVLLSPDVSHPSLYLRALSNQSFLTSLPLVTLTAEITEAANQIDRLLVFPCLASTAHQGSLDPTDSTALLQVIQVAAGLARQPHILVLDALQVPQETPTAAEAPPSSERLKTLMYYLQAAGFQGSIGQSWSALWRQLEHQTVDLLLLILEEKTGVEAAIADLECLIQLQPRPPVLVLDYRLSHLGQGSPSTDKVTTLLKHLTDDVLIASISVQGLLDQINRILRINWDA